MGRIPWLQCCWRARFRGWVGWLALRACRECVARLGRTAPVAVVAACGSAIHCPCRVTSALACSPGVRCYCCAAALMPLSSLPRWPLLPCFPILNRAAINARYPVPTDPSFINTSPNFAATYLDVHGGWSPGFFSPWHFLLLLPTCLISPWCAGWVWQFCQ